MGQAALQYDEFDDIEPIEVPAGGIATFLTATEGSWATDDDDDIPQAGIASVKRVADQLATFGRHEDEYMIHAAEGETVIPMEVFRKNPILKERIFQQMRDMGIEPERYVVGNELNSLNPVTGQPEFFLKKLFKGLKRFVKKAVTVVLPIVGGAFFGPLGAAAGSGIATLINGGNFKDAFKSAAISGLTAGLMNGISGGMAASSGGGSFSEGFTSGAFGEGAFTRTIGEAAAAGRALGAETATSAIPAPAVSDVSASAVSDVSAPAVSDTVTPPMKSTEFLGMQDLAPKLDVSASGAATPLDPATESAFRRIAPQGTTDAEIRSLATGEPLAGAGTGAPAGAGAAAGTTASAVPSATEAPGVVDSFRRMFGIGPNPVTGAERGLDLFGGARDLFMPSAGQRAAIVEAAELAGLTPGTPEFTQFVAEGMKASASLAPSAVRKFAPGIVGLAALDSLTREEPKDFNVDEQVTGFTILDGPEGYKYRLGSDTMKLPSTYTIQDVSDQYKPLQTPVYQPVAYSADGGEIENFPRMTGRIDGPGTETSDDIPAMLSDGEFVFTAKAVRGAGSGNREKGMKNMYALMSKFERMA